MARRDRRHPRQATIEAILLHPPGSRPLGAVGCRADAGNAVGAALVFVVSCRGGKLRHGDVIAPVARGLTQLVELRRSGFPFSSGEVQRDGVVRMGAAVGVLQRDDDGDAGQALRYHIKGVVVACVTHQHRVGGFVHVDGRGREVESEVFPLGQAAVIPATIRVLVGRQGVDTLAIGVLDFYLGDAFVPREVLAHGKLHGREGMAELKACVGGLVACGILHFARASRHQVDLIFDVLLYLEGHLGRAGMGAVGHGDAISCGGLGKNGIEAGVALRPGPLQRRDEAAGGVGGAVVEPFGLALGVALGVAAAGRRGEAGVDGRLDVGTCAGLGQHGGDALKGGLYDAGLGQAFDGVAARCEIC